LRFGDEFARDGGGRVRSSFREILPLQSAFPLFRTASGKRKTSLSSREVGRGGLVGASAGESSVRSNWRRGRDFPPNTCGDGDGRRAPSGGARRPEGQKGGEVFLGDAMEIPERGATMWRMRAVAESAIPFPTFPHRHASVIPLMAPRRLPRAAVIGVAAQFAPTRRGETSERGDWSTTCDVA